MGVKTRIAIGALAFSAAGLVALVGDEGYIPVARRPVPGDPPTVGFGNTRHADGSPVRPGETITPPSAVRLAARDISAKESVLKSCITGTLTQGEYDAYVRLAYNVGASAVCRSSIPKKIAAGEYAAACKTILDFRRVQGRDCSLPVNARFCGGVWLRRQEEYRWCMGEDAQ